MNAASPLLHRAERSRNVTAVLGPTNTGKTHLAIDRMLARRTGLIGLPLRLLAREVYGRIVGRIGPDAVALVTGEEKIVPPGARYYVATVEAMPLDLNPEFVAIDEVQLASDLERGRVFTDRILRVRGQYETLLLGAITARQLLEKLLPGVSVVTRPRMSMLTYAGEKKLTRLPPRSAVVAFSANEVYAIAELIRRQRGGAAIVMGALSPRTRNAQVELFQSGDVDFLIATDAIGMGLNLDVDHVAFASNRKFDGYQFRALNPAELGQIAGRAGRHTRDGTFGVTGRVAPFDNSLVEALETHAFQQSKVFQWRNPALDFSSVAALRASLDEPAQEEGLTKAPPADDQKALEHAAKAPEIMDLADTADRVARLWEVCQVPDYRKIAPANHADLLLTLYNFLISEGTIPDDWIARQVRYADKTDGDIDTLSNRIAHIRTWTFVANRNDWLADPAEWRETTRNVEDRLSDALHERLMQRFVDRRTSVLMKRLRENAMLESEVNDAGDVMVEGQHVGSLHGFRFQADASADDPRDAKALRAAASKALAKEMERRADKMAAAPDTALTLGSDAAIRWQGAVVAKVVASDDTLKPSAVLLADDNLPAASREKVQARLTLWLSAHVTGLLKPLFDLRDAQALDGGARGLAYRMSEQLGSVERASVAEEAKALDQTARAGLRALGVRFGAYHIFVPALLKPAPSQLMALLWALKNADLDVPGLTEVPQLSASGRTSIALDPEVPKPLYQVVGFRPCGPRAVRIDILERLADQIRPLVAWRPGPDAGDPPPGAVPQGGGFLVTVAMTSLLGCSGEDFAAILTSLGYRVDRHEATPAECDALKAANEIRAKGARQPERGARPVPVPARAAPAPATADLTTTATGEPEVADASAEAAEQPSTGVPEGGAGETASDGGGTGDSFEPAAVQASTPEETATDETAPEAAPTEGSAPWAAPADDTPAPEAADTAPDEPAAEVQAVMEPAPDEAADAAPEADDAPADTLDPALAEAEDEAGQEGDAIDTADTAAGTAAAGTEDGATGETTGEAADGAEAEVVMVEVWRVPRHHRGDQPRRRRKPGQQENRGRGSQSGERRRGGEGRGPAPGGDRAPQDGPALAAAPAGGAPAPAAGGAPRHDGPGGRSRDDRQGKGKKRGKPQQQPRPEANKPPKREREADPDSPFAKLAALKEQMEKRDR
ncbi:helicase-related protein [Acuticoccus sp. I52.16.1]|uniref:helicase-related protein n=1 Tax=Acuticoccus sp. I52.16.1 TaxID=2928472 RepID=UPI001FD07B75|nr:helicase-related protein [Acuticoccus sp. I52.16.1]UOM32781.1 helicase [Acuticoccus sp. I52.16.1]